MGYKTKVQCIKRQQSEQWYINFPSAMAQAMEFSQSENVEWIISDKRNLILHRPEAPGDPINIKKNSKISSDNNRQPFEDGPGFKRGETFTSINPPYIKSIGVYGTTYTD